MKQLEIEHSCQPGPPDVTHYMGNLLVDMILSGVQSQTIRELEPLPVLRSCTADFRDIIDRLKSMVCATPDGVVRVHFREFEYELVISFDEAGPSHAVTLAIKKIGA